MDDLALLTSGLILWWDKLLIWLRLLMGIIRREGEESLVSSPESKALFHSYKMTNINNIIVLMYG